MGGDIYYIDKLDNKVIVAVIDCTGHGVPGAFMTMLASSGLRRITVDEHCRDPAEILAKLNRIVKKSLQQDTDHASSDDGMDAAVCVIDEAEKTVKFAGANLPLTYIHDGEIHSIKGDRESLGYRRSDVEHDFSNHEVKARKGTVFYLYTDGITDQLGGEKRRMYGNRRLRETLLKHHNHNSAKQKESVIVEFEQYRSDNEVQDDITLIGFKM
ncbi:MAG: serine/threonine-protein phosphatase [Pseudomonadales bacterium]|nr:serine/threonine-protein phosphatase [Pseudomonadales bacterium]